MDVEAPADVDGASDGSTQLTVMPGPAAPQPRTARPVKTSFLDDAMQKVGALFTTISARIHTAQARTDRATMPAAYAQHPALRALAEQTARVARIGQNETVLMAKTEGALDQGVGNLRNVMRRTGINPDSFARKVASSEGVGGPEIPLDQVQIEGISDPKFTSAYLQGRRGAGPAERPVGRNGSIPLAMPVAGRQLRQHPAASAPASIPSPAAMPSIPASISPAPGAARCMPRRRAPWCSPATAAAMATWWKSTTAIGIHTRYGHLSPITVQVGAKVGKGAERGPRRLHRPQHRPACALRSLVRRRREEPEQLHRGRPPCSLASPKTPLPRPSRIDAAAPPCRAPKRARQLSAPSIISADMVITGTLISTGDIQIDGRVEGDVRSVGLVIGDKAEIHGEIFAEDVTVRGKVMGRIRARKVLLAATSHVEGDILHEAFAVESGAFFEGNCRHSDNPLGEPQPRRRRPRSHEPDSSPRRAVRAAGARRRLISRCTRHEPAQLQSVRCIP